MTSLTSIFNFLYVYLRVLACYIFGGRVDVNFFSNLEQIEIVRNIIRIASNGQFENGFSFPGQPILLLVLGVFALGSIIGLVRRLIR